MTHPAILTRNLRFAVSVCLIFASCWLGLIAYLAWRQGPVDGRTVASDLAWIEDGESPYQKIADQLDGEPYWSPDGTRIVELNFDGNGAPTTLRDARDLSVIASLPGRFLVRWSPNGKLFTNWGYDAAVYDSTTGRRNCKGCFDRIFDVSWSPDSTRLAICMTDQMAILDIESGTRRDLSPKGTDIWIAANWSPDGRLLAAKTLNSQDDSSEQPMRRNYLKIFDPESLREVRTFKEDIGGFAWSPDGKYFAYAVRGEVRILDGVSFGTICSIKTDGAWPAEEITFPDTTRMAFNDRDNIHIYSTTDWKVTRSIVAEKNGRFSFLWSQDRGLMMIRNHGTIALCDGISGKYLGYRDGCSVAEFMPDGESIGLRNGLYFTIDRDAISCGKSPFAGGRVGAPPWSDGAAPKNLEECFAEFDRKLSPLDKNRIRACRRSDLSSFFSGSFNVDSVIRSIYCTWDLTDIEKYYLAKGVTDPQNVLGSVIEEYWLHLNSKPAPFLELPDSNFKRGLVQRLDMMAEAIQMLEHRFRHFGKQLLLERGDMTHRSSFSEKR
ncbi:MAG: PD40 domain-containing protein [Cyanobacteria bacterium HKST-UBA02]|nr:PD40 domain-containing protein [Cyanobacteria bacterium HKST-UBA02]